MQTPLANAGLLTVEEVAGRLRVKPSWVYSHADELGAYRLGKYLRFSWERVLDRMEQGVGSRSGVGATAQRPPLGPTKP